MEHQVTTLNCRGRLVDLAEPKVMGILNITPDSFYDGGQLRNLDAVLAQGQKMLEEGADFLDIGGMSSRPGAALISGEEELDRVLPVIELLREQFPEALLSLDTIRSGVAKAGLERGVHLINDISAGAIDPHLLEVVAAFPNTPYVLMHMQGKPATMQAAPEYKDVLLEVFDFLAQKISDCRKAGITDVIVDPGFGFGKSVDHNYRLLKNLRIFQTLEVPILVGISRKSMICKVLKVTPANALNGTTALHMVALQQGARILRVHDVLAAKETIRLWQQLQAID
jgi:dihydropteroate synthase